MGRSSNFGLNVRRCLFAVLAPFSVSLGYAQTIRAPVYVLVNPEALESKAFAPARQRLLAESVTRVPAAVITVKPGDTLSAVVLEKYGFGSSNAPNSQASLINAIRELNGLGKAPLRPGDQLKLPTYFKRPYSIGATNARIQALDQRTSQYGLATIRPLVEQSGPVLLPDIHSLFSKSFPSEKRLAEARTGGVLAIRLDETPQALFGKSVLSKHLGKDMGFLPSTKVFIIKVPALREVSAPFSTNISAEKLTVSEPVAVPTSRDWHIYLLDVFSNNSAQCAHGDLVYDRIVQTLRQLGAAALVPHVVKVDINFFAHRAESLKFVGNWVSQFRGAIRAIYEKSLKSLSELPTPNQATFGTIPVPGFYLQAVYGTYLADSNVLSISSSFYTLDTNDAFPKDVLGYRSASLLAAVIDSDGTTVESTDYEYEEPLQTFYRYRRDLGTILVGYNDANGAPLGMYSSKGDGVTTLDYGVVTGETGACRGKTSVGASFATPVVTAKLSVARLLWLNAGIAVDALGAQKRLLMAATIQPRLLGKYWSAGIPDMRRLARTSGALLVRPNGDSSNADSLVGHAYVSVLDPTAGVTNKLTFGTGEPETSIFLSLQLNGGEAFVFNKATERWSRVNLKEVCLCDGSASEAPLSFEQARQTIRELTYYESPPSN